MCGQRLATRSASAKPFIEPDISISVNSAATSPRLSRIAQASSAVAASTTLAGILQLVDRHDGHSLPSQTLSMLLLTSRGQFFA
ncbi:hypothetical protein ASF55_20670 [Methylobacterium sp. Leaf119]|nr:hypothetical protein ASF55_20670 [Methylobacterium sp. Leaf119]